MLLVIKRLSVENDSNTNKVKKTGKFQNIFPPESSASLVVNNEGSNLPSFRPKSIIIKLSSPFCPDQGRKKLAASPLCHLNQENKLYRH